MPLFSVCIDVRYAYRVTVSADDEDSARTLGNNMQTTVIRETGDMEDVETEVTEVEQIDE